MSKISKSKKEEIVNEILNRKFKDRLSILDKECMEKALSVIAESQKGIPFKACQGYISYSRYIYIYRENIGRAARKDGQFSFTLDTGVPTKSGEFYFHPKSDPWVEKFISKKEKINQEKEEMSTTLMAVINSCNTEKQLFETLPEIEPIYKDLFNCRESVSLVAIETVEKAKSILAGV